LSYTLSHLRTFVKIKKIENALADDWKCLQGSDLKPMDLSAKGREKFLRHFSNLKQVWGVSGSFLLESANNFPSDCGLASSASSFAALTRAASVQFAMKSSVELALLSRRGSGSSCRSFFSPWCLWSVADSVETVGPVEIPYIELLHMVVVVDDQIKSVSSSEAHLRINSSPLFLGRPERAENRIQELLLSFREQNWRRAYQIVWDEFIDMHELFHTSIPGFRYMTEGSQRVLNKTKEFWEQHQMGPLVTMDAGANVHLLFRPEDFKLFIQLKDFFASEFQVIDSTQFKKDPSWSQYGS
jgi:diphosphomevalonate decarboxylase